MANRYNVPGFQATIRPMLKIMLSLAFALAVQSAAPAVSSVKISPETIDAEVGQQITFTAAGLDAEGKSTNAKPLIWFAAPFDIAAADTNGSVTFYAPGEARIGALVGGKIGYAKVRIKPPSAKSIDLPATLKLVVAGTTRVDATARAANGDPRADALITWTSENPKVAMVDAAGVVTGIAPGKTFIVAKSDVASARTPVDVVKSTVRSLVIEPRVSQVKTGDVIRYNVRLDGAPVRWSVSGEGATIDSDGAFYADRPGSYVITGTAGELAAAASVVVAPRNAEREVELVGRIPFKEFQAAEQWFVGDYAYVSTLSDKVVVYDIKDPANPKLTETVKVDARVVNDVSTTADGRIAVVTREGASSRKNGIVFLDTSDPAHPKIISEYTATVTGGVHSAFIDRHYVYLTDDATGSMRVIDFKDVKNPKEVARWQVENALAKTIESPAGVQSGGRYLHDVQVKDGLAYLAYWRDGVVVLDVGNGIKGGSPEKPMFVSQLRFNYHDLYGDGWLSGAHEVYRYKNYLFVGDEVFPAEFNIMGKTRIPVRGIVHVLDVSDIEKPKKVAEYNVPEGGAHNIWVTDDILVMGYYSGGGRILDVSGELRGDLYRQGREIARVWTGDPEAFRPNLPFTWGARHYRGLIYFNDVNSGLWAVKLGKAKQKGSTTAPGN